MKLVIDGEVVEVSGGGGTAQKPVRHMVIFEESGVFNPADYGLGAGDTVNVTVVGGGEGGYAGQNSSTGNSSGRGDGLAAGAPNNFTKNAESGRGYGAGGGGGNGGNASSGSGTGGTAGDGGSSGEVVFGTVTLESDASIPITVGAGGTGGLTVSPWHPGAGEASSFGTYFTAMGGDSHSSEVHGRFRGGFGAYSGRNGGNGEGDNGGRSTKNDSTGNSAAGGRGGGGGGGYMPEYSGVESGPITMVQKGSGVVIVEWFG